MSLRRRIALTVGVIPAAMVLVFGAVSLLATARSLQSATDDELTQIAGVFETAIERSSAQRLDRLSFEDADVGPDSGSPFPFLQVVRPDGSLLVDGGLPLTDAALAAALSRQPDPHFETVEVDGQSIRILTSATSVDDRVGAIQLGRDITDITVGLRRSRDATVVAGLLAGLVSAGIAWSLSRRLVAPVRAVADAADRLRSDANLPHRIEGEGPDELGRLVSSFNGMLDELRHSRTQQQRLVADASHELRTPLTSLRVKTEFLQSQPGLAPEERQRLVDGSVAELASLSTLVSELVELAADGGRVDEAPRIVDLGRLVEEEAERFRASTGRRLEVTTTSGMVETRPQQVARALLNLLVNADKYTSPDHPIEIRQRGNRIEVRDHGPGIRLEDRDRVFDRFFRGPEHQSIEGSGLGLAIVESTARANGGTTWIATPADGQGVIVGLSVSPSES